MVNWFSRRRKPGAVPRLSSRSSDVTTKVDLAELTPQPLAFLGQAAYVELTIFENLSAAVAAAPTIDAKASLSRVAASALAKHTALAAEIEKLGHKPGETMEPFTARIDAFQRDTKGDDWYESIMACHIQAGFLDDFFRRLAVGLPDDLAARVSAILGAESHQNLVADELRTGIETHDRLAARLAMWGRRLVGDTMLIARSALRTAEGKTINETQIEPVFSELIASHTRRMDALGLTA